MTVAATSTRNAFNVRFSDWICSRREILALLKSMDMPPHQPQPRPAATSTTQQQQQQQQHAALPPPSPAPPHILASAAAFFLGSAGGGDMPPATGSSAVVVNEMRKVAVSRRGAMLNTDTILKLDQWFREDEGDVPSSSTGAPSGGGGTQPDPSSTPDVSGGGEGGPTSSSENIAGGVPSTGGHEGGTTPPTTTTNGGGGGGVIFVEGATNLRRVPHSRVYGVSTLSVDAVRRVTQYLVSVERARVVHFINLREEPLIYVRDRPFVLRSVQKPFQNLDGFSEIDSSRLERAEDMLKRDVLDEAERCGGKVLVHVEQAGGAGLLTMQWEEVDPNVADTDDDVSTPKDVWSRLQKEGLPVEYQRIAMTPESVPTPADYDEIMEYVRTHIAVDTGAHLVFFCQRGRGRSTVATIAACLELDTRSPEPNSTASGWEMRSTLHVDSTDVIGPVPYSMKADSVVVRETSRGDFPPILSLIRVLKRGPEAKRALDHVVDRCGAVLNIRQLIAQRANEAFAARSEDAAAEVLDDALLDLRRYFSLLTVAAYELEIRMGGPNITYAQWLAARPEIRTLEESIKGQDDLVEEADVEGDSNRLFVANRTGQVLVRGSILKTDHFPGCRRLANPKVVCEGAPNFRAIWPEDLVQASEGLDLRMYGTGIPTTSGVKEVWGVLKPEEAGAAAAAAPHAAGEDPDGGGGGGVLWLNLREEPIIYINARPFVLRRLDQPFANLEHTGISRARVEDMESRLKQDVLDELALTGTGRILIHEEDESGGLNAVWEDVEQVRTPGEVFEQEAREVGFPLKYVRIPITDEQSPKASALDTIMDAVCSVSNTTHVIFNCQMGRGRTTTGLIVATATRLRRLDRLGDFAALVDRVVPREWFRSRIRKGGALEEPAATELRGDFNVVLAQVRLLGADAKRAMDACVDVCDAMQNLREAIHDVKKRSLAPELDVHTRMQATGIASHYLRRYVQLLQLAAYLKDLDSVGLRRVRFSVWVKSRPELGNSLRDSLWGGGAGV